MTQEDKELLLKDLSTRLPYDVCVHIKYNTGEPCYGKLTPKDIQWFIDSKIENIKPYLRPMSSMTEEERKEYNEYLFHGASIGLMSNTETAYELIDWLNVHHFDYRGLIPIGLALEAPEDMYKTK